MVGSDQVEGAVGSVWVLGFWQLRRDLQTNRVIGARGERAAEGKERGAIARLGAREEELPRGEGPGPDARVIRVISLPSHS